MKKAVLLILCILLLAALMLARSGEFVLVEKGSFTMGDTWGDGYDDEKPAHQVTLTYDFYIGKYETTFNEYDAFCDDTGRSKPGDSGWGKGSRPVIYVSWNDAVAYCNWLSEKEDLPKAYDSNGNLLDKDGMITTDLSKVVGYRLPTEAEWEYAARGGNKSKGYKYSGSDNVDDVAWYWQNSGDKYLTGNWDWDTITKNNCRTQEVGKKAANELGIYDMSGNVWEWCSDWYETYSSSAQTNPYNSAAGSSRVVRGGCWGSFAARGRVATRSILSPAGTDGVLGFRIARTEP
jgi:formylglycine-generating enzyme required for sulfatase activity